MYLTRINLSLLFPALLLVISCKQDEEHSTPADDNEAITIPTLTLTNQTTPVHTLTLRSKT